MFYMWIGLCGYQPLVGGEGRWRRLVQGTGIGQGGWGLGHTEAQAPPPEAWAGKHRRALPPDVCILQGRCAHFTGPQENKKPAPSVSARLPRGARLREETETSKKPGPEQEKKQVGSGEDRPQKRHQGGPKSTAKRRAGGAQTSHWVRGMIKGIDQRGAWKGPAEGGGSGQRG